MKNPFQKIWLLLICSVILCQFQIALAADQPTPPPIIPVDQGTPILLPHQTSDQTSYSYFQQSLLPGIAAGIITITAGISLLFVVYGGILMLTSYASPENFKKGTSTLTWAIAGLIISGLSYAIVKIVASLSI